jgi:hypothetical protein
MSEPDKESNPSKNDPQFIEFAGIFGCYFYRPNSLLRFRGSAPLELSEAYIPLDKLADIFRYCIEHEENPSAEVLMRSLKVTGWLRFDLTSGVFEAAKVRDALKPLKRLDLARVLHIGKKSIENGRSSWARRQSRKPSGKQPRQQPGVS